MALTEKKFEGTSLAQLLGEPVELSQFFRISTLLTQGLNDFHQKGFVHKDIKPKNIFLNSELTKVKFEGLQLAAPLLRNAIVSSLTEGTLAYMSPEHTGRVNRPIDQRSDLYSLGIVFFEMLTGRLPFENADSPLEWVYNHIAREPELKKLDQLHVPAMLTQIIAKLLAKTADDRYQTAEGLLYDLKKCQNAWLQHKAVSVFKLGANDHPERLLIPHKLYGRKNELSLLLQFFSQMLRDRKPKLVLISGYSGIGKTAVVNELQRPIVQARGQFISGKFDQYKRATPYYTFVSAFQKLILNLLSQSESEIQDWIRKLKMALDGNGQLIIDIIPELELLIGPQSPVDVLAAREAQIRFSNVFQNFIGVFASPEHPLTLFLDDLQWADAASMSFLKDLLTTSRVGALLIVGAYRDNEVNDNHPLGLLVSDLRKVNAAISEIFLQPLTFDQLNSLVADMLKCSEKKVQPLVQLISEKTAGNPFFVIQFLTTLFEENNLIFDRSHMSWQWDLEKIRSKEYTSNVLQLVIRKLLRLSESTQNILKHIACLGSSASVEDVKTIFSFSEEVLRHSLSDAQNSGVLSFESDTYEFLHDRLHEAAYSLIPEDRRAEIHLQISRRMLSCFSPKKIEKQIFEVVDQISHCAHLLTDADEKERNAGLYLIAAEKAKAAAAYKAAAYYAIQGWKLLSEQRWKTQYDLTFSLSLVGARSFLADGNVEQAEMILGSMLTNVQSRAHQAATKQVQIQILAAKGKSENALLAALELLRLYDLEVAWPPTLTQVEQVDHELWKRMNQLGLDSLKNLPLRQEKDKDIELVMEVLSDILPSAYYADPNMHRLIACVMVDLTLRFGVFQLSPMAFAAYGLEMCIARRYAEAEKLGDIAKELVDHYQFQACRTKVYHLLGVIFYAWTKNSAESLVVLKKGLAAENGDFLFKSLSQLYIVFVLLQMGTGLSELSRAAERAYKFIETQGFHVLIDAIVVVQKFIHDMRPTEDFQGRFLEPVTYAQRIKENPIPQLAAWDCLFKLQTEVYYGNYQEALHAAAQTKPIIIYLRGQQAEMEFAFFYCMAIVGYWKQASREQQNQYWLELQKYSQQLKAWAELNPNNYRHRWLLVAAEIAQIEKNTFQAQRLFELAAQEAIAGNYIYIAALTYERAAQFYRQQEFNLIYETYLKKSHTYYLQWGATGKTQQLEKNYPEIIVKQSAPLTSLLGSTFAAQSEQLDFLSVIKASQVISGQIVFDDLVLTLLKVVLQQSGARKAVLALWKDQALSLEAMAEVRDGGYETQLLEATSLSSSLDVPVSIVRFVQRVKDAVIFADASREAVQFSADEYIVRIKPKSLLCLPILRGEKLVGVLYLENNLSHGVFSEERLSALTLIATQMAISLQNAQYYRNLKEENIQRKKAEEALRTSQKLLQAIIDSTTGVIAVRDLEGRFILVNRQFEIMLGRPEKSVIGKTDYDLFSKEHAERLRQFDLKVLELGEPVEREMLSPLDGDAHTYLVTKFPLYSGNGQVYAVCTVATDITNRIRIEKEREQLLHETQKSVQVRDDFISIASHELRTPLTPLRIALDMLRMSLRQVPPEVMPKIAILEKAFGNVENIVDRMTRLTEDLLDMSLITSGRLQLNYGPVDLVELVRHVIDHFKTKLERSRCALTFSAREAAVGHWDSLRIQQVVENLLSNAMKYGRGKPIEIYVSKTATSAQLIVVDHGIGIAPSEQAKIFERFARAVSVNNYGGLGLGLYITREILLAHGGSISVQSELGKGAAFTVELPLSVSK